MRGSKRHERRWASDTVPRGRAMSSPGTSASNDGVEFVEVTLDLQGDDTIVLRSVEPAPAADSGYLSDATGSAVSRSPSIGRSSSHRLRHFSQELKAEAVARARQLKEDLKAELKRFTWGHGPSRAGASTSAGGAVGASPVLDSALAARAARRQRAQLDRTRSGAQKALRGLRFISGGKATAVDAWNEVQSNFDKLARDGYLSRSDFAQCIGFLSDPFAFQIIMLSASANKLSRLKEQAEEYAALIMEELDPERLGYIEVRIPDSLFYISLWQPKACMSTNLALHCFQLVPIPALYASRASKTMSKLLYWMRMMMQHHLFPVFSKIPPPEWLNGCRLSLDLPVLGSQLWQLETLLLQKDTYLNYSQALSYTSQALSQNLAGLRKKGPIRKLSTKLGYYLEENWKRLWVMALWVGVMAGLFAWKFIQYRHRYAFQVMGYCLTTAKGAAETLKLNMALILLPVCRNTITWLRSTRLARALPFDDNINFHKVIPTLEAFNSFRGN
ncbi:hypothetical protein BHM03_00010821 [Ensete ventricosum]|uniref:NADPH oxidase Respiratory burst domain-containing protein n=1 Tax=Ensete ventricosum TaxID=4639 RepID=A0A445MD78_ENSVE|nr:hypothetical protein BHM03_00010821 [Ensete ventricosum]